MALPLVGLFFFRIYENQLVRQTEAELIARVAAIGAIFRARRARPACRRSSSANSPTWIPPRRRASAPPTSPYRPIRPQLDLAGDDILARVRNSAPAAKPDAEFAALGARLRRSGRHPGDAGRVPAARSAWRRHRRRRRSGPLVRRRGGGRAALAGHMRACFASASPRGRRRRSIRSAAARACASSSRCRSSSTAASPASSMLANAEQHRETLYGERGKVMLAAICILGARC